MGGTIVLTLIEALLILLALLISKAFRFVSPSLYGDQLVAVDDSPKDDVILTQTVSPPSPHMDVSPPVTKYDVFLSFRGEDTRHTFASYLYKELCKAGIDTFMDYELWKGGHIRQVLLNTIEQSEVSMIIFSENYASSTWCMDELVHIMECKKKFGRVVVPIFYNVDPSDIRKRKGSFGNGFDALKRRFKNNPEELQKRINALVEATSLSGWDSKNTRPEFKLVEEIVKDVLSKLNYNSSYHLEGLVGIAPHIRNIKNLLSEARIVGIWGMGGVGKTTLAKAIFQELRGQFDAFSFIENVKEKLKGNGLDKLQQNCLKELLKDEEISIYDIKSTFVKNRLGRKKILLILDDVDDSRIAEDLTRWIYWFREGSRIMITSRDMQVLKKATCTEKSYAFSTYHVPNLDLHDSLCLFSLKAFNQHESWEGCSDLSASVVEYCQGNPLTLEVLGCFFYGREKEEWESALEKLDEDPPKNIVDVLKLSFDGLDEKQQNVFLDLAFLINERAGISSNLIEKLYDSSAPIEISVLREKSLISFDNNGFIVMHDLVKKMGLKIARKQSIFDAKTPIRLWRHEDIADLFNCGKGVERIRCLSLDVSKGKRIKFTARMFQMMHNLIYLKVLESDWGKDSTLSICGDLDYFPEELRFFVWEEYPLSYVPLHFCAENLVRLEMRNSNIRQLWEGNLHFPNLEKIDLSHSEHLTELPDLSDAPRIQRLWLRGCRNLAQIHSSTFLPVYMSIRNCGPLQIKIGGSMKGRSSGSMIVCSVLDLERKLIQKVTSKTFVCGTVISGVRLKQEEIPLEEMEELRKETESLLSLLPFVRELRWLESPIEFGDDIIQHFEPTYNVSTPRDSIVVKEERGDRGEMKSEVGVLMEDDVLMEGSCSKSVNVILFTRVPKSITRWSLLTKLTLKSLPLSNDEYCYCRRIKPLLDLTLSSPHIASKDFLYLGIGHHGGCARQRGYMASPPFAFFCCKLTCSNPDSIYNWLEHARRNFGSGKIADIGLGFDPINDEKSDYCRSFENDF